MIGRRPCFAARMAQKTWRDDEPARGPLLRRAVARARGAIQAILVPGIRALALLRDLPQRALAFSVHLLQRLVPDFLRRQLRPRQPCPRPEMLLPPPPPPTPTSNTNAYAWIYGDPPRPPSSPTVPPPPPPQPPAPPLIVGGEEVSDELKKMYADYCKLASTCPANKVVCHFCFFEMQRSPDFTVRIDMMISHCDELHTHTRDGDELSVRCGEGGCRIRARPGGDLERHKHFFRDLPQDWWSSVGIHGQQAP